MLTIVTVVRTEPLQDRQRARQLVGGGGVELLKRKGRQELHRYAALAFQVPYEIKDRVVVGGLQVVWSARGWFRGQFTDAC